MKITKISLEGFRAFDVPFELDLPGGKNLLLHGENGSGKSSIFLALKRFFEERGDSIDNYRNDFSPDTRTSQVRVQMMGADTTGAVHDREFCWNATDGHPLRIPGGASRITPQLRSLLVDGARRAGFLDYRAMLRTHLLSGPLPRLNRGPSVHDIIYGANAEGLEAQLFDLFSLVISPACACQESAGRRALSVN